MTHPSLELALYRDLARTFRAFDLSTVADQLLRSLAFHVPIDYAYLLLLEDEGQALSNTFHFGFGKGQPMGHYVGFKEGDIARLVQDNIPVFYDFQLPSESRSAPSVGKTRLGSVAVFPGELGRGRSFVLLLAAKEKTKGLDRATFDLLSTLIPDLIYPIKNSLNVQRKDELISRDDLTHAFNRRFFEEYIEEEIDRARRFHSPLSVIFLDLDGLRHVNTEWGHSCGSKTLQEATQRTLWSVRNIDKVFRWGGDEFCVVLPETEWQGALEVAERIRHALASQPFLVEETGGVQITGSMGVASYPTHALNKEDLVRKADEAMYRIKARSKDAIEVASPRQEFGA